MTPPAIRAPSPSCCSTPAGGRRERSPRPGCTTSAPPSTWRSRATSWRRAGASCSPAGPPASGRGRPPGRTPAADTPGPGETLRHAVERRLRDELGLVPRRLALAVPDFVYRAAMDEGTVEHELCPVVVAEVDRDPRPDPDEVDDVALGHLGGGAGAGAADPGSLSPWSVEQIALLATWRRRPWPGSTLECRLRAGGHGPRPPRRHPGRARVAPRGAGRTPVAAVRGPVERIVDRFLADRLADVADLDPRPPRWGTRCAASSRPAASGCGPRSPTGGTGPPAPPTTTACWWPGGRVELLHTFALLHDDVMDRSADPAGAADGAPQARRRPPARRARRRRRLVRGERRGAGRRPGLPVGRPSCSTRHRCRATRWPGPAGSSPGCAPR